MTSLYADAHFIEGEEPEVNCSSFTNNGPILISNASITIYVPRAFQRAVPRPLILQHNRTPKLLVRAERFRAIFDIRSGHSSCEDRRGGPPRLERA